MPFLNASITFLMELIEYLINPHVLNCLHVKPVSMIEHQGIFLMRSSKIFMQNGFFCYGTSLSCIMGAYALLQRRMKIRTTFDNISIPVKGNIYSHHSLQKQYTEMFLYKTNPKQLTEKHVMCITLLTTIEISTSKHEHRSLAHEYSQLGSDFNNVQQPLHLQKR